MTSDITDNFISKLFQITNRNDNLIYTVEWDRPIVLIGGFLTIMTDNSEVIDLKVISNAITYIVLRSFRIENNTPHLFIDIIKKLVLNPGDQIFIQASNSYGVSILPEIHGNLSFVRQPKLN